MKKFTFILFLLLALTVQAEETNYLIDPNRIKNDSTPIYQALILKLDLATPIIEAASSKGHNIDLEAAVSLRLKNRIYPTFELGYARSDRQIFHRIDDENTYTTRHYGQGAFLRVGLDLNGLKKHPERMDALLVGVRFGTALQGYSLTGVCLNDPHQPTHTTDYIHRLGADCWGEIAVGCQVKIVKEIIMGWHIRMKLLITRNQRNGGPAPYYIPGFGYRDNLNWGISYYIGYKF